MTTRSRTGAASVAALAAFGVAVGAAARFSDWVRRMDLDVWNLPALRAECEAISAERIYLDSRHRQLVSEVQACDQVARRLADGRVDLAAATDTMIEITSGRVEFAEALARAFPEVRAHRCRVARRAITRALQLLCDDPARRSELVARLATELAAINLAVEPVR
ncbi:hypothetical protein J0H58_38985 [bacterium]|nr:hypothetical protein [bacterium]